MRISYTPQQEELRRELRSYFATLMTPERREALSSVQGEYGVGNVYRETIAQMGRDGWLALGWPKEYGGQGRSAMDQLIFTDEAAIAGAPVPFLTINSVAPTIMAYGTDEQKRFSCPGSPPGTCTSRSATPSPAPAPTWPTCAPPRFATAMTMWSTARRCGPA